MLLCGACDVYSNMEDPAQGCPDWPAPEGDPCVGNLVCEYPNGKAIDCRNPCPYPCKVMPVGPQVGAVTRRCEQARWQDVPQPDAGPVCPVDVTCVCRPTPDPGDAGV